MNSSFTYVYVFLLWCQFAWSQNSVGTLFYEPSNTLDGYTLIYPDNQPSVFLINNCGQIINQWDDDQNGRPGTAAYLMDNGDIIKAKTDPSLAGVSFGAGGAGGIIERHSWDNELIWRYQLADSIQRQHHQFEVMPNGNLLIIAWEKNSLEEIVSMGFDTVSNSQREIWSDYIIELNPESQQVVWEWHSWDHLVQDHDETKLNFGSVSENPFRIDINYQDFSFGRPDWMHANAIDYNPVLDQIIISVRNFGEMWIIDHSTTTMEAASSSGGSAKKGGDIIYRWGNPAAYKKGTLQDQRSFNQHDVSWIDEVVHADNPYFGDILFFNNFIDDGLSKGQIFSPIWDAASSSYEMLDGVFLPQDFSAEYIHPMDDKNFSTAASSIQILENGNVLMCAARQGRIFELTNTGRLAWEYLVPLKFGTRVPQGFQLALSDNFTVRAEKYPINHPAFVDKDLSSKGYIEIDPIEGACIISATYNEHPGQYRVKLYPNPTTQYLYLESETTRKAKIINALGLEFWSGVIFQKNEMDISSWPDGIYFLQTFDGSITKFSIVR